MRLSSLMRCARCQTDNLAGSLFCSGCGARLDVACAACRAQNRAGDKFCRMCGTPLGGAVVGEGAVAYEDANAGERRQITVMFCDLVDSTVLGQRLDPEELQRVIRAYQDACAQVVRRYEGHLAQYAGDGLLVYFGYPHAHEDDAERALQAGLAIVDAIARVNADLAATRVRLAVRIGVHSGVVVAGVTGGPERENQMFGHTMNLAARIQSGAPPDSVVASAATLRLVGGRFVTRDLGARELK